MISVARMSLRVVGLLTAIVGLGVSIMGPAMGANEVPADSVGDWYWIRLAGIAGVLTVGQVMFWCGVALARRRRWGLIGCGLIYATQTVATVAAIASKSVFSAAPSAVVALPPFLLVLILAAAAVTRLGPQERRVA